MTISRWTVGHAVGISAVALAACTSIPPPPTPEAAQIKISLSVSRADAYQRTVAAFVAEGLNVSSGSAEGGTITTVPVDAAQMVPATYRATIVTIDSQTVVVLSGNIRNNSGALMAQAMTGLKPDAPEFPLHSAMKGDLGKAWQRLERVAARLRGT